jgi:hypothetical protein
MVSVFRRFTNKTKQNKTKQNKTATGHAGIFVHLEIVKTRL